MHKPLPGSRLAQRLRVTQSSSLALSTIILNLVRIVSTMCLTRLLSPDVYGIVGMITSIFFVITMLTDVGFQAYIVRHHRSDDDDFINSVWTIHAIRGVALTIVAAALASPLSMLLQKPQLAAPLAVASFTFAIEGLGSLGQFRGLRQGRVQRFALMDLLGTVAQIVAAIAIAVFIRSVWAIVASMLIGSMFRVWLSYVLFPGNRRSLRPSREVGADLWRFSRVIAASSALALVMAQADKLALGRIMTLSQFGTYVIASTLAAAPTAFAWNYAGSIVYPAVSAAWRDNGPISEVYYRCWGKFFYLYALGGGCLIGGADLLIRLLYDPRYAAAARYLSVLAVTTSTTLVTRSMENALVASGITRATVEVNVTRLIWLVGGGAIALERSDPIIFVATIGLMDLPAYLYSVIRMNRLHLTRWPRELTLFLMIGLGFALGSLASWLGRALLPNL